MEALKQLEKAQEAIHLVQSQCFNSSNSNSNSNSNSPHSLSFLENFIHFLAQPCGELDMETKCQLIYANLPNISTVLLQESESCSWDKGSGKHKQIFDSLKPDNQGMAMVGLEAMQDANSTLGDFPIEQNLIVNEASIFSSRSYFMFHDIDVNKPESVFRFLPILSFTESYIYQLDRLNEKILNLPNERAADLERDSHMELNESWDNRFIEQFKSNPFGPLAFQLQRLQLLTDRIRVEFRCGEEYWGLERKLCTALAGNEEIFVEDVMRAIHLKSFDYRVLNLLLYQLRGEKDDVMENSFNVLRMFVRIYGASAAPTMLAKCITDAEEKYEHLLRALGPQLAESYQKRCEEATKEGGKIAGPSLGTWTIPPVIRDEDSYRCKFLKLE